MAASLAETRNSAENSWSTEYLAPASSPTADPSATAADGETVTTRWPGRFGATVSAVRTLRMLAGW